MSSSDSKMNRLRKRLYDRDQSDTDRPESDLSPSDDNDTPDDWQHNHDDKNRVSDAAHSWLNKLLLFAGIFCVLSVGFAVVVIGFNPGGVSPNQVDIAVAGPDTISAGETVTLTVDVTNNNEVALEEVVLTATFPPGTRRPDTSGEELRRIRRELGVINPQETNQITLDASLFGQQDQTRTIEINLEYQVAASNAIFTANNQYAVTVGELPVAMTVSSPEEAAPGQPINFSVRIQSNSAKPLRNLVLRANYPFGFSASEVSPEPIFRDYVWSLGDLAPGEERTVDVSGRFESEVAAGERSFQFRAGIATPSSPSSIGTLFASRSTSLQLRQPPVGLSLVIDESSNPDQTLSAGEEVEAKLTYRSNTDTAIRGADINLSFPGEVVDLGSVIAENGLYRQSDRQITWNAQTFDELETISPGETNTLIFSFTNKAPDQLVGVAEPAATMLATLSADTPQGAGLPETITTEVRRSPRIASHISVQSEVLRAVGPFDNDGPVPPEVGRSTDYTLHFTVSNTTNQLSDARLQAAVPAYVEITGQPEASQGTFAFNDVTGRLEWSLDTVASSTGYQGTAPAEIFIPVTITPVNSQVGQRPELLTDISVTAFDEFIGREIVADNLRNPTTEADDIGGDFGRGVVQDD